VIPRTVRVLQDDTHRLIPAAFTDDNVLERLAATEEDLDSLFELEGATNDRLLGEMNALPGIGVHELLFGVSYAHIVNAAFTHAHPGGSRFNDEIRGAWYASFELETAQAEIAFHKEQELAEVSWEEPETFHFTDYLADFRAEFHDIRRGRYWNRCLAPASYIASQKLAGALLSEGSAGLVYPSVRRRGGTCLVCFRPALVLHVRRGGALKLAVRTGVSEWSSARMK
jgi:hypothetical protein